MKTMQPNRLMSMIHLFGSSSLRKNHTRLSTIKVGTGAVARRVKDKYGISSGSRQKQVRKRPLHDLPNRKVGTVRQHKLAKLVEENLPIAKKSGCHKMKSKTQYKKAPVDKKDPSSKFS